jgi:hypothetical protein
MCCWALAWHTAGNEIAEYLETHLDCCCCCCLVLGEVMSAEKVREGQRSQQTRPLKHEPGALLAATATVTRGPTMLGADLPL